MRRAVFEYISVAAAAKMLGVTRQRVYQLLESGALDGKWSGDTRLVKEQSVLRRIETGDLFEKMEVRK